MIPILILLLIGLSTIYSKQYQIKTPEKVDGISQAEYKKIIENIVYLNQILKNEDARIIDTSCKKLYGRYCGPGWCDNKFWDGCNNINIDQQKCNTSGSILDAVDSCCRTHDKMCLESRTSGNCLKARSDMVTCLINTNCNYNPNCIIWRKIMKEFFIYRSGCC